MKKSVLVFVLATFFLTACDHSKHSQSGDKAAAGTEKSDSASAKLNGTWQLNYISGPRIAFDGLYPEKKPTLTFSLPSLEASGNSSCNGYSCNFTLSGNRINFADARSTMMACPGGGEQTFFKALKQINSFNVSVDTTLTLIMGDIAMMRFSKQ